MKPVKWIWPLTALEPEAIKTYEADIIKTRTLFVPAMRTRSGHVRFFVFGEYNSGSAEMDWNTLKEMQWAFEDFNRVLFDGNAEYALSTLLNEMALDEASQTKVDDLKRYLGLWIGGINRALFRREFLALNRASYFVSRQGAIWQITACETPRPCA